VVFGDGCGLREGDWLRTECRVMVNLDTRSWPVSRLGEALEALARQSGFSVKSVQTPTPPQDLATAGKDALGRWLEAAGYPGLEAEPVGAPMRRSNR